MPTQNMYKSVRVLIVAGDITAQPWSACIAMCIIRGSSPSTEKEKREERRYSQQRFQYRRKGEGVQTPAEEWISIQWLISTRDARLR